MIYRQLLRPFLFQLDAEQAHGLTFSVLGFLLRLRLPLKWFVPIALPAPQEEFEMFGLQFKNRLGLAAGFDKNTKLLEAWSQLGFGFVEIGTVTPKPQKGNERPRLFRLIKDQAIINRMGFNNDGVEVIAQRLKKRPQGLIVGGNIGKNKDTPKKKAIEDYLKCMSVLHDRVDFFTINISSPNTPGLRSLQEKEPLSELLKSVVDLNKTFPKPRPILLKIAPDLNEEQLDDVIEVVKSTAVDGLILNNTTLSRERLSYREEELKHFGAGGLSGQPLFERSNEVLKYVSTRVNGQIPIIAVGGVMSGEDAVVKLKLGASLVQIYSGLVYKGPELIVDIRKALQRYLL